MASLRCWRCLPPSSPLALLSAARTASLAPPAAIPSIPSAIRSFSTTDSRNKSPTDKPPPVKKGVHRITGKHKQVGTAKKKKIERGPKVRPGERKAFRKRIVLSNTNALPVALDQHDKDAFSQPGNVGSVLALGDRTLDKLRSCGAFKPNQSWGMFRQPATLVRKETVDLCTRMNDRIAKKQMLRCVLSGDKVSGKSTLLLQALAHAYENGWIVLNIAEARELVISHADYMPIEGSELWAQPSMMQGICRQLLSNNGSILSKLTVSSDHDGLLSQNQREMPLSQLANMGKNPEDVWPVFKALWYELTEAPNRPPVVVCVDGIAHAMKVTAYKTKQFEPIHAHDLGIIKSICDLMAGRSVPSGGGAVITAIGASNCPRVKSVEYAVAYKEAVDAVAKGVPRVEIPEREPYCRKYDPRVDEVFRDVEILKVGGLDKREARSIMEYWAASGMYRHEVDELRVTETWTMGGSGILGEMERASLRHSRI